jgi:hypothetical protein
MKGKLEKIGDKWFVRYVRSEGGGSFRLPLHPNFVEMTDFVYIKNERFYDGDEIDFTEALVNPMGRDVDPNDLGQNHSLCKWYAKPYLVERGITITHKEEQKQHLIDMMESDEELGLYDESREIKFEDVFNDDKKEKLKKFISQHKKKQLENDWEEILFDFIDFYPCILPHELFEWLEENYEIPKKKDAKHI